MSNHLRQLDIIDPNRLVYPVTCIGLGGIGSFVAPTLRKLGFRTFRLVDDDAVDEHNVPCQHYSHGDIGLLKVTAMEAQLRACLDEEMAVTTEPRRFASHDNLSGIVVCGVDNMASRQSIWEAVKRRSTFIPLFVDGRIGVGWNEETGQVEGEWIEVFTINPANVNDIEFYASQLFSDDEAAPFHCTAQAVVYIGHFISGFMASNIKKWVCGQKFPRYLLYDVLTLDLVSAID